MKNAFKDFQTATLLDTKICYCRDCGWPIVDLCCNGDLALRSPYADWDWWMYCSNPCCKNHGGEGVSQNECTFTVYPNKI